KCQDKISYFFTVTNHCPQPRRQMSGSSSGYRFLLFCHVRFP
ncbi:hypothetical protein SLEP1_g59780, partial [Rubroshorea leprosula]